MCIRDSINGTFKMDVDGKHNQINGYAYSSTDAFFDACGRYHLLNTCNSWAGRALKQAGVRVPWFSPMPKTPMLYIEKEVAFEWKSDDRKSRLLRLFVCSFIPANCVALPMTPAQQSEPATQHRRSRLTGLLWVGIGFFIGHCSVSYTHLTLPTTPYV